MTNTPPSDQAPRGPHAAQQRMVPGMHPGVPTPPVYKPSVQKRSSVISLAIAALVGLIVGAAASGIFAETVTIPKWADKVAEVTAERDAARTSQKQAAGRNAIMKDAADAARKRAETAEKKLSEAEKSLSQREQDVSDREAAATKKEETVAASMITQGTWTVGRDIKAGTYVTEEAVTDGCYWAITKSGSNGDDILSNDNVSGGRPTVTLKEGQDFESHRCGSWVSA